MKIKLGAFLLSQIQDIAISCLCLGSLAREVELENDYLDSSNEPVSTSASLPSLRSIKQYLLGGSSLIRVGDLIFVTALQIQSPNFQSQTCQLPILETELKDVFISLDKYLLQPSVRGYSGLENEKAMGVVTRRQFCVKLNDDGSHSCCKLTVGCVRKSRQSDFIYSACNIQNINLCVSFAQSTARVLKLSEKWDSLDSSGNVSDSQKILASAFWALGESGCTFPLTVGGSEDFCVGSLSQNYTVHVCVPVGAMQRSASGYVSSRCFNFEVTSSLQLSKSTQRYESPVKSSPLFDFEGDPKRVTKGIVHKRLHRRNADSHVAGELIETLSDAIPTVAVSQLVERMCQHLYVRNGKNLDPSLVRRVCGASLLGVSFCLVQSCCSRCFCPLINKNRGNEASIGLLANNTEQTFWHLPLPRGGETKRQCLQNGSKRSVRKNQFRPCGQGSHLQCPNFCSNETYYVKWECSATLDDGTGQATLYANGDSALMLLGMTDETVEWIEAGVCASPNGCLVFKKTVPPSKNLRNSIQNMASHKVTEVDTIRMLPLPLRAEYLLQTHCRSSSRPRRPLDYFVRCKPLLDRNCHLHHTAIDTFYVDESRDASSSLAERFSYILPSLKLELVDCGIPTFDVPTRD